MKNLFHACKIRTPRIKIWLLKLGEFGLVQGVVQVLGAFSGLLLVRGLPKHDYTLFVITNAMQATGNMLADLGIGIGIRSIGGRVWNDPERFGQLLNTALRLRRRFAFFSLAVTLPVAAWMLWRNNASLSLNFCLLLTILAGILPLLGTTVWSSSLQFHQRYREIQRIDLGNACTRLALIGGLALTHINALFAAIVGAIGNWIQFIFVSRKGSKHANRSAAENAEDRQELIQLSIKSLPNAVFISLQAQIFLLILSLTGNPTGIADVMALGRITALFAVFSSVFTTLITPRFAQCQVPSRLPKIYLGLVVLASIAFAPLILVAWIAPGPLLWVLGGKYAGLQSECVWVMATGCISQIASVMWGLNSAKAWISISSTAWIPLTVTVQAVMAATLNLHDLQSVLLFQLITVFLPIPLFALDAWKNLGRKKNIVKV